MKQILAVMIALMCFDSLALSGEGTETMSHRIIRKSKTFDCPIDTMWWKWTTHEGLKTFFGEDNNMELKIGGPFEIYFSTKAPAGLRGSEGCKVISYMPKEMLSFNWNAPPKFANIRNGKHHTWVVVTFKATKNGKTEVKLSHLGWLQGNDWNEVYDYFDKAWVTVFDWLEESCRKVSKK